MEINPDWPCRCGHTIKDHIASRHFNIIFCKVKRVEDGGWLDTCEDFTPISNLEYLEMKTI